MPQIGWFEILVVVVLAILIIGPKDFPIVVRKVGKWVGSIKKYFSEIQRDINEVKDTFEDEIVVDKYKKDKSSNKEKMNESKDKETTFINHLTELRSRLLRSIIYIFIFFIISYIFAENIYSFLVEPYANAVKNDDLNRRLIYTALHETFITYLKVSFFASIFIGSPFIITQIWKFVAPGLYKNEKKALLPYLIATPTLFILGGVLVYYLIMPLAINFF